MASLKKAGELIGKRIGIAGEQATCADMAKDYRMH